MAFLPHAVVFGHGYTLASKVLFLVSIIFDFLLDMRVVWLSGYYGQGKTALSLLLAKQLIERNYASHIAININLTGLTPLYNVDSPKDVTDRKDTVIILDEAWRDVGRSFSPKQIDAWLAFIGKGNNYVIAPSVRPLARDFALFIVQRRFNGMKFGLPFWVYKWRLDTGVDRETGHWCWWWPQEVWPWYDHEERPLPHYNIYDMR